MQVYKGIVNDEIMDCFSQIQGVTLMNHTMNACKIEHVLASASIFCPEIIQIEECIFISEFFNGDFKSLKELYGDDRKSMEAFVNAWSLSEFFSEVSDNSLNNCRLIEEFGKVIKYFWERRTNELFPNRNIVIKLGYELEGESGLTITMYQE